MSWNIEWSCKEICRWNLSRTRRWKSGDRISYSLLIGKM